MRDRSRCYRRHFSKGAMRVVSRAINRLAKDSISGEKKGRKGKREMRIGRALWPLFRRMRCATMGLSRTRFETPSRGGPSRNDLLIRSHSSDLPVCDSPRKLALPLFLYGFTRYIRAIHFSSPGIISAKGEYDISFSYLFYLNDVSFPR